MDYEKEIEAIKYVFSCGTYEAKEFHRVMNRDTLNGIIEKYNNR